MSGKTKGRAMPFSCGTASVHTDRFGCVNGRGEVYWHPAHGEPPSEEEALQRLLGALRWAQSLKDGVEFEVIEVKVCGDCPWFRIWSGYGDGGCAHLRTDRDLDEDDGPLYSYKAPPPGCGQRKRDTRITLVEEAPE